MRMRALAGLLGPVVVGMAFAGLAGDLAAQEARKVERVDTVTVSEVDPSDRVLEVRTPEGATLRFHVDEKTLIQLGDQEIDLRELEPGDRVAVNARPPAPGDVTERLIADVVTVVVEDVPPEGGSGS